MATMQEEGLKDEAAAGLTDFSPEEVSKLYEIAGNHVNSAIAKTLDQSKGDAPVYVLLAQKGSPFANYLSGLDPQLYTLMTTQSQAMEVKAKQMKEMLLVYEEKNLNDIGFREPKKTVLDKIKPSTLLGAFMGAVLGFFASKQIVANLSVLKNTKDGSEKSAQRMAMLQNVAIGLATVGSAVGGFIGVDKIPLLSKQKKAELHEEVGKLSLGELNDRIHQLNGEIRVDHESLLEEVKKAAIKADVLKMMKEVVSARATEQRQQLRTETDGKVDEIDDKVRDMNKTLHKEGQGVVSEAAKTMGVARGVEARKPVEPRSITPESIMKEQQDPNRGRAMAGT